MKVGVGRVPITHSRGRRRQRRARGAGVRVRAERCQLCWIRDAQTDRPAHELGVTESLRTGRPGGCADDGCRVTGMGSTLVLLFY